MAVHVWVARGKFGCCMAVEARLVGPGGARSVSGQVRQSRWRTLGWVMERWRLLRSGRVCQFRQVMSTFCGVSPGSASYGSCGMALFGGVGYVSV